MNIPKPIIMQAIRLIKHCKINQIIRKKYRIKKILNQLIKGYQSRSKENLKIGKTVSKLKNRVKNKDN